MHGGKDNYTYLTTAPIRRVIPTMAVPTIVGMLVTSLYVIADTFFVGQLDTQSTAAVGVVFPLMFFMQAFGFFFGHGSGNYISRELGARRHGNARRMAADGFFLSLFTGLVLMTLGLVFLHPLALLLGSTPTILPLTESYLSVSLLGMPFLMSSLTLNNQLRLQGNAAYAMVGIVTGAVLNVALDPFFIFLLDLKVQGAALATVIGQVVSFLLLFRMSHHEGNIGIYWRDFAPSWPAVKEIFYGGSPSMSRQGLLCVSTMLLNHAAGTWGDAAIAGMSIVGRITMLVMAVVIGLGQGFQPLCGFCYGAKLYSRLGVVALRWQLLTLPLCATMMSSNMLTQTCRKPWRANLLAASRNGLFFIPSILVLPCWLGLTGVEVCQSVSDLFAFIVTVPVMVYTFRELRA